MSNVTRRLTNKQPVDPVRRLFEYLNQPSESRLKQVLRARQIRFTDEEASTIVKGSTAKQVFAPKPRADGKVVSCLLYTSPSPRDGLLSRMPSSA